MIKNPCLGCQFSGSCYGKCPAKLEYDRLLGENLNTYYADRTRADTP